MCGQVVGGAAVANRRLALRRLRESQTPQTAFKGTALERFSVAPILPTGRNAPCVLIWGLVCQGGQGGVAGGCGVGVGGGAVGATRLGGGRVDVFVSLICERWVAHGRGCVAGL